MGREGCHRKMGLQLLGCARGCPAVPWMRVLVGKMHREGGVCGSPEIWDRGGDGTGDNGCQGCVSEGAGKGWVAEGHRVAEEAGGSLAGGWGWAM